MGFFRHINPGEPKDEKEIVVDSTVQYDYNFSGSIPMVPIRFQTETGLA
jgi:hypothetical protein